MRVHIDLDSIDVAVKAANLHCYMNLKEDWKESRNNFNKHPVPSQDLLNFMEIYQTKPQRVSKEILPNRDCDDLMSAVITSDLIAKHALYIDLARSGVLALACQNSLMTLMAEVTAPSHPALIEPYSQISGNYRVLDALQVADIRSSRDEFALLTGLVNSHKNGGYIDYLKFPLQELLVLNLLRSHSDIKTLHAVRDIVNSTLIFHDDLSFDYLLDILVHYGYKDRIDNSILAVPTKALRNFNVLQPLDTLYIEFNNKGEYVTGINNLLDKLRCPKAFQRFVSAFECPEEITEMLIDVVNSN